jgi:para-aminobenzoate synthetase component 1
VPDGSSLTVVPVHASDLAWIDPHEAAAAFADQPALALLDSTGPIGPESRYSYLCIDPFRIIAAGHAPMERLESALAVIRLAPAADAMPFRGGAAGFIGYELGAALEGIPPPGSEPDDPPSLFMGLYDLMIGFDRVRRICRIHATGLPETEPRARRARAVARIAWATERLASVRPPAPALPPLRWRPDWTQSSYEDRVRRVLQYIGAGDIFQANLTQRHQAPRPSGLQPWAVHAALRRRNPAPFGAWMHCGDHDLCCSSPERFLRVSAGGAIETRPIKGTSARNADPIEDAAASAALAVSTKDRAENVMIVDVLRNDLGRVAEIGSVAVPELCALKSYATVHHLVSTVTAQLRAGLGPIDLLRAALPGGSITGAPKIRAMQIIAELEAARRGPYCGCVAWIGFDGSMDSNIVIRSLVLTPRRVIAQSGGGIVADSQPHAEYEEMMLKSAPMRDLFPPVA